MWGNRNRKQNVAAQRFKKNPMRTFFNCAKVQWKKRNLLGGHRLNQCEWEWLVLMDSNSESLPQIAFIEWRMTNKGQIIKNKDQLDCKSDGGVVDWSCVVYECMSVCMSCDGPVQGTVLPQVPVKSNELLQFACSLCPLVCCIQLHSCCSVFSHFALGKPFSLLGNEQMRWGK